MAKTVASCKQKGRRLAKRVAEIIRATFNLNEDDVYPTPGGVPGEDIKLSEKARQFVPYSIELKNVEKINIWSALEQAESKNRKYKPLLVFSRNRSEDYCSLKFQDFINILIELYQTKEEIKELKSGEGA